MVRNKLCWDANNAAGLPKQRTSYQSSPTFLCFESPTVLFCYLRPSVIYPVPCDRILQRAYSWVSFSFLYGYGVPLGGPSGRRSSAIPPPQADISVISTLVTNCNHAWSQGNYNFYLSQISFVFCGIYQSISWRLDTDMLTINYKKNMLGSGDN